MLDSGYKEAGMNIIELQKRFSTQHKCEQFLR